MTARRHSSFQVLHCDPVQKRRVSAALVVITIHLLVAYIVATINIARRAPTGAEDTAALVWLHLADPEESLSTEESPQQLRRVPARRSSAGTISPPVSGTPAREPSTAITQPAVPGLEVLGAYVACGLSGVGVQTMEEREKCEQQRVGFGDGRKGEYVPTEKERALWAKFAEDKAVQEAGFFSVCSNRGGTTISLTIRIVGGELFIGDAANARRKSDRNMLDDSGMPGARMGCDTPEGSLFKPMQR